MVDLPWLTLLLALPLAGALSTALVRRAPWAQRLALASSGLTLLCSLCIVVLFERSDDGFQFVESARWIPGLNVGYLVGVDGLSVLFLPATALLFAAAVVAGWRARVATGPAAGSFLAADASAGVAPGVYFSLLFLLEAATLGVFCALDALLFYFCWESTLPPLYFLVSLWGLGAGRQTAAVRYFLVMLAGGVPLLFGLLAAAFGHGKGGVPVFDLPSLLATPLPESVQMLVFLLLLVGFGVKVPLVSLHTWLPSIALGAPAAVTALLVGLKLGVYGLIRFAIPLAPLAARDLHWLLAGFGTLAMLYGSVAALVQSNLRGMLAYASLAHVGLVLLGLASFSVSALQGAVLQLLNFSLAAGGGFLVLSFLQRRYGSTDAAQLGLLFGRLPLLSGFFLLFGLAGIGLPGTSGFPGELLIIVAALHDHTGAGLAALFATVVGAAAFLAPYRAAFFATGTVYPGTGIGASTAAAGPVDDLLAREIAVLLVLAGLIVLIGVHPMPWLELIRPAAEAWVAGLAGL